MHELNKLFDSGIFVFDTNVLLNLYRYNSNIRSILLESLEELSKHKKVWLPYQIAKEFASNRDKVIIDTINNYEQLENEENKFIKIVKDKLRLDEKDNEIEELQNIVKKWIDKQKMANLLVKSVSNDDILDQILDIFDKKVGDCLSDDELNELKSEYNKRCSNEIPPGYCDKNKENGKGFGDLIIWKQIIKHAKDENVNIIYITNDSKEDWWQISSGHVIGPRFELREEFSKETGKLFYMYTMNKFLEYYSETFDKPLDQSIINELNKSINRNRAYYNRKSVYEYKRTDPNSNNALILIEQIHRREKVINEIQEKYLGKVMPMNIVIQLQNTVNKRDELLHRLNSMRKTIDGYDY